MRKANKVLLLTLITTLLTSCGQERGYFAYEPLKTSYIEVSDENITLKIGESTKILANAYSSNGEAIGGRDISYTSSNDNVLKVSNSGLLEGYSIGNATVTATVDGFSKSINVNVIEEEIAHKSEGNKTYKDIGLNSYYGTNFAPSVGKTHFLVIPTWFSDSQNYISEKNKDRVYNDIEIAFLGTKAASGWQSVKTYYEEESKGLLEVNVTVSGWYDCGRSSKLYYDSKDASVNLVKDATNWYKTNFANNTLKDFDSDSDGHIDGVILVYAAPDYASNPEAGKNMWAYCDWIQNKRNTQEPTLNVYVWASYSFLYSKGNITHYGSGDTSHCFVDTHTIIHEMGHVFGLEDYYDYSRMTSPCAGFSMSDYDVGNHDPYSIFALGWANPYMVDLSKNNSYSVTLNKFVDNHDLLLISNHAFASPFDEYFLLEYYTPTRLNEFDSKYSYCGVYPKGPSESGVRLWHVDARLVYTNKLNEFISVNNITNNVQNGKYYLHALANSRYSSGNTEHVSPLGANYYDYNILQLIRNSQVKIYKDAETITNNDLFKLNKEYNIDDFAKQFKNAGLLNDKTSCSFKFSITNSGDKSITINITKN